MLSDEAEVISEPLPMTDTISFQIKATPRLYELSYRLGKNGAWTKLGEMGAMEFLGYDFTRTIFGVFASSQSEEARSKITFENFLIR